MATIRCDDGYLFVGNPVALTTPAPTTTTTTTSTTTPPTCCKLKLKDKSLTFFSVDTGGLKNEESVRGADFNDCCLKSSVTASIASECCSECHQSGVFDVTHMTFEDGTCNCYSIPGKICPMHVLHDCLSLLEGKDKVVKLCYGRPSLKDGIVNPQVDTSQHHIFDYIIRYINLNFF